MDQFIPEQKKQLVSWADQRDSVLREIGDNKSVNERLIEQNKELALSSSELTEKIQQSLGRLIELSKREESMESLISAENVDLIAKKTQLQTEIENLKTSVGDQFIQKQTLIGDIIFLIQVKASLSEKNNFIDEIMGKISNSLPADLKEMNELIIVMQDSIKKILVSSTQNIDAHTKVLNEIPKLFVELHRKSLDREIINKHK